MISLILYAFLQADANVKSVQLITERVGTYRTMALCVEAKEKAIKEAKRMKWKQVGGACQLITRKGE